MSGLTRSRWGLRALGLGYLAVLLLLPLGMIFYKTFEHGFGAADRRDRPRPTALHALKLTLLMVAIAVPLNTVFGVGCALLLVRHTCRGKRPDRRLDQPAVRDLAGRDRPLAVPPLRHRGWFGPGLAEAGIQVLFSAPGMVLASIFVSLPFVVREAVPVLQEIGTEQEQAAATLGANAWQTFWRVTLPAIRWGSPTASSSPPPACSASSAPSRSSPARSRARPRPCRSSSKSSSTNFNEAGAYAARSMVLAAARPDHPPGNEPDLKRKEDA